MVPASFKGKYVIRFTVTSQYTRDKDLERDWLIIQNMARSILNINDIEHKIEEEEEDEDEIIEREKLDVVPPQTEDCPIAEMKKLSMTGQVRKEGMKRKREFGLSLILSNVPMSPKFINGSFAALFDTHDVITEYARHLNRRSTDLNGQPMRMSPRKRFRDQNKQYSFDLGVANRRPWTGIKYQASLDSKIEELFDSSFDSTEVPDVDGDEAEQHPYSSRQTALLYTADKAVQSPDNSVFFDASFDADKSSSSRPENLVFSDSTVDTLSSPVDGATYFSPHVCKHCGHPIEH